MFEVLNLLCIGLVKLKDKVREIIGFEGIVSEVGIQKVTLCRVES
jgi:hypothetical protein